jgi:hypothetical protein
VVGTDRLADRVASGPALLLQGPNPFGGAKVRVEVTQHDIEVVQTAEPGLQTPDSGRKGVAGLPLEPRPYLRQMPESANLDPQPVEPDRGRTPASPSVGPPSLFVAPSLLLRERARQVDPRPGSNGELETFANALEQVRVALGAEEHSKQLPASARIVAEPRTQSGDQRDLLTSGTGQRRSFDQLDDDVPVADPADEPGQSFEAAIERDHQVAVTAREQLLPEREGVPQPAHLSVKLMEALRGGVGPGDDLVHRPGDFREKSFEFLSE